MFSSGKRLPPGGPQIDHDRLITLINSLSDGFLAIDLNGVIEMYNSVALSLLDTNQLLGKNLYQVLHLVDSDNKAVDLLEQIKTRQKPIVSRDYQLKLSADISIDLFISMSPLKLSFGSQASGGYVVLLRDITREKTLEKERDEFISVASHELRTPVTIAEGSISNAVLIADKSHLPESIKHSLKSAHEQLVFLQSLINDLAMLSRADRGKLAVIVEEVNLSDLINTLMHDYQPQAAKKGLEIKVQLSSTAPIYSAKLYIREILQNFITNAIKYTEKGAITIASAPTEDGVTISVSDSGIGIDKNEQAKLFTKFYRSEDFRVRQISGTGLGLYISIKLAKLIGGSISMHSQLNQGSTFSLNLPASVYHQASPKQP